MAAYTDNYWWSHDNLRLHYRDYPGRDDRPPIICLPGLTRNARDFAPIAERLSGEWRVICPELRGRGESAYARDPMSYVPLVYLQDLEKLLVDAAIGRFVGIGTSLGGIMLMLLGGAGHAQIAGALFNDIGPEIAEAGLARIRENTGSGGSQPTWVHAARTIADANQSVYPDYQLEDWLVLAKRMWRINSSGRVVPDYDAKIAEPLRLPGGGAGGVDLWPALRAFAGVPSVLVRGALSDLLTVDTAERMVAACPGMLMVTVPRVGHAPTLTEPESTAAIDDLLARVLAAA